MQAPKTINIKRCPFEDGNGANEIEMLFPFINLIIFHQTSLYHKNNKKVRNKKCNLSQINKSLYFTWLHLVYKFRKKNFFVLEAWSTEEGLLDYVGIHDSL